MAYGFQIKDATNNLTLDTSVNPPNNLLDVREIGATEVTSFNVAEYNDSNSWYVTLPMPLSGQEYVEMVNYADIGTSEFYGSPIVSHTNGTNSFSFTGLNYGTDSNKKLKGLFIAGKYRGTFSDDFVSGYGATFRNENNDTIITTNHSPFFSIARGYTLVNSNSNIDSARNSALSGTRCFRFPYNSSFSTSLNPCENRIQQIVSNQDFMFNSRCAYYSCNSRHDFVYDSSSHVLPDGRAVYPLVFLRIPNNVYVSNLVFHRPSNTSQTGVSFWAMTTTGHDFHPPWSDFEPTFVLNRGRYTNPMGISIGQRRSRNFPSTFDLPNPENNYFSPIEIMLCYAGNAPNSSSANGIELYDANGSTIFNTDMTCPSVQGFESRNYQVYENTPSFTSGGFSTYTNYADNAYGFNLNMQNSSNWICINSIGTGSRAAASGVSGQYNRGSIFATEYIRRSGSTAYYGTGLIIGGAIIQSGQNYRGIYQVGRKFLMEVSTPT